MSINPTCPKCGSNRVQLTMEKRSRGFLWFLFFGVFYIIWVMLKWVIGIAVFMWYDWWMALVDRARGKQHVWAAKRFFTGRRQTYFCHDCCHNFKR